MPPTTRTENEAAYALFDKFVLNDQRNFYEVKVSQYRNSSQQVNKIRAILAFTTGLASALAGLVVQSSFDNNGQCLIKNELGSNLVGLINSLVGGSANCSALQALVVFLIILAVIMPAMGGAFNILADLYQWDRLITIYSSSLENIEIADAQSPDPEMDDMTYRASLNAFSEGTLGVMYDETAQWGQLIRTPETLSKFVAAEQKIADQASGGATSAALSEHGGFGIAPTIDTAASPTASTPPIAVPPAVTPVIPAGANPPSVTPPTTPNPPPDSNQAFGR